MPRLFPSFVYRHLWRVKNGEISLRNTSSSSPQGSGKGKLMAGASLLVAGSTVGGGVWYASQSEGHRKYVEALIPGSEDLLDIFLGLSPSKIAEYKTSPIQTSYKPVDREVLKEGDGSTFPKSGQKIKCHYVLTLNNGKVIDSSRERGKPLSFRIGRGEVIAGWEEGLAMMSLGERAKLTIPPEMGYGGHGVPGAIPPNATLHFDIELLGIDNLVAKAPSISKWN